MTQRCRQLTSLHARHGAACSDAGTLARLLRRLRAHMHYAGTLVGPSWAPGAWCAHTGVQRATACARHKRRLSRHRRVCVVCDTLLTLLLLVGACCGAPGCVCVCRSTAGQPRTDNHLLLMCCARRVAGSSAAGAAVVYRLV
jgi:hypothetical protein